MEIEFIEHGVGEAVWGSGGEFTAAGGAVEVGVDEVWGDAGEVTDFFGVAAVGEFKDAGGMVAEEEEGDFFVGLV